MILFKSKAFSFVTGVAGSLHVAFLSPVQTLSTQLSAERSCTQSPRELCLASDSGLHLRVLMMARKPRRPALAVAGFDLALGLHHCSRRPGARGRRLPSSRPLCVRMGRPSSHGERGLHVNVEGPPSAHWYRACLFICLCGLRRAGYCFPICLSRPKRAVLERVQPVALCGTAVQQVISVMLQPLRTLPLVKLTVL